MPSSVEAWLMADELVNRGSRRRIGHGVVSCAMQYVCCIPISRECRDNEAAANVFFRWDMKALGWLLREAIDMRPFNARINADLVRDNTSNLPLLRSTRSSRWHLRP